MYECPVDAPGVAPNTVDRRHERARRPPRGRAQGQGRVLPLERRDPARRPAKRHAQVYPAADQAWVVDEIYNVMTLTQSGDVILVPLGLVAEGQVDKITALLQAKVDVA